MNSGDANQLIKIAGSFIGTLLSTVAYRFRIVDNKIGNKLGHNK